MREVSILVILNFTERVLNYIATNSMVFVGILALIVLCLGLWGYGFYKKSLTMCSIAPILVVTLIALTLGAKMQYQTLIDEAPLNEAVIKQADLTKKHKADKFYQVELYGSSEKYNIQSERTLKSGDLIHFKVVGDSVIFEKEDLKKKIILTNKDFTLDVSKGWISSDEFTPDEFSSIQHDIADKYDVSKFNQKDISVIIEGVPKDDNLSEGVQIEDVTKYYENLSTIDNNDRHQINLKATNFNDMQKVVKKYGKIKIYLL